MNKADLITPRTLQGFRDYLPTTMLARERIIGTARRVYQSFGFAPIDTPALEYLEILAGKGSEETDKQLYKFQDAGERWVGLRFDLTVPLARFAAQHIGQLGTPFKRYHIGTVWRGERPQRGRFREFMQCDFDTIGTKSLVADTESALVIHELLRNLGFDAFTVRLNNRQVLNGLLQKLSLLDQATPILRSLDKLAKIGPAKVAEEMVSSGTITADQAQQILKLAHLSGTNDEILSELDTLLAGNELGEQGVHNLRRVLLGTSQAGVDPRYFQLDVSIARGLDYYTGTIFETFLTELPAIGSICSGGRYDNLAELYTKQELPGIGASLGLDRLIAAMEELGWIEEAATPAPVFMAYFDKAALGTYWQLASWIRQAGIGVELYPEPKKLGQQLKYADRKGFPMAIIAGADELAENRCQLKLMKSGESIHCSLDQQADELVRELRRHLSGEQPA